MMLHYHPHYRPSIVDIIGHPWMRESCGPTATSEQVRAQFAERDEINRKKAREKTDPPDAAPQKSVRSEEDSVMLTNTPDFPPLVKCEPDVEGVDEPSHSHESIPKICDVGNVNSKEGEGISGFLKSENSDSKQPTCLTEYFENHTFNCF